MKILVLLSRVPWPLEKGDKLRAFHHIKEMSRQHEVILCCLSDKRVHPQAKKVLSEYCSQVHIFRLNKIAIFFRLVRAIFSSKPFQVHYFYKKTVQKQIDKIVEREMPAHIFVQLIRTAEYAKKYPFIPNTFDYMDAFSRGVERRIKYSIPGLRRLFITESNRLKHYEASVFKFFQNKIIISEQDRDLISHPDKNEIEIIPNGVDLDFYQPSDVKPQYTIGFTGNMAYPPNVRAALFLASEVLPLVQKELPDASLLISGTNPVAKIKSLDNGNDIIVTGWVKDIRDSYTQADIFVAPMQIGTGLQNKLLEAMAMKKPCITSELANQALGAVDGKEVLIGFSAQDYADIIVNLTKNKERKQQLADKGYQFVQQNFSWDNNSKKLLQIIEKQ
ncbi:glycosyltransferase [Salibacter halophilus]|uniref:Glycosyltransferase n=1 Tax=Salibacter halophilus TaxID=1803916 RepID=A0A6N6M7E5_9FLAO|nr:glycosyltransferase [Salibacter halophilus]KAB1064422.1 glycosyltransferase [Salibacter halophilus]